MTKIPMNKLTAKTITIEETNELLAALESVKLWQLEIERAEEARKKADAYLDQLIAESLKQTSLKWMEGELIKVTDYNRLYCYINEDFTRIKIPSLEGTINEGIL
jgi:hypothetical protein